MTITISAEDPRSIKALEIAAGASQWLKVRSVDGELAFGIPSQCKGKPSRYYLVTRFSCDCEDFKRHGLSRGRIGDIGYHGDCKHLLAVHLYDELVRAQQAERRPRRSHLRPVPSAALYERIHREFGELD